MKKKGKIIAAFGIPGSGKSSTTSEIGKILNFKTFHEPEESEWGDAVFHRNLSGSFTAIMWFRSLRVPQYFLADELRISGITTMLDSYYDKLFHLYLESDEMDWLIDRSDLYYNELRNISAKDYKYLPDVDILIFFRQTKENWKKFILKRNRDLDNDESFKKSFNLQEDMLIAAEKYCKERNCELIIHDQSFSDPMAEAKKISKILEKIL